MSDPPLTSPGGAIAAERSAPEEIPILVGLTEADEFNTIAARLIPKGCFRVEDVRFAFDTSFPLPDVAEEMPLLADLIEIHSVDLPGPPAETVPPPLSIFGHADPVGNDDYNKQLSGRRATAIYAMLVRDTDLWEELYSKPLGGDDWGTMTVQRMLEAVGHSPGPIDGVSGEQTRAAVKSFQTQEGLTVDGIAGPNTRAALFLAYMDLLCGPRLELDKDKNFLARNQDPDGKGDFQGCSEFNPILMFSKAENDAFAAAPDKSERNRENAPNRRVVILLFAPGRRVVPEFWPCPRTKENTAACRVRFFPDADHRRSFQEERREFHKTHDTFACRFYQLITDDAPCERFLATFEIRVYDHEGKTIPRAPFELVVRGGGSIAGKANAEGIVIARDVEVPNRGVIHWGLPPEAGEEPDLSFSLDMYMRVEEGEDEAEARQRLHNLGYSEEDELSVSVAGFQQDYGHLSSPPLEVTGVLDEQTKKLLRDVYNECAPDLRNTPPGG
jgi:hypothetical protein